MYEVYVYALKDSVSSPPLVGEVTTTGEGEEVYIIMLFLSIAIILVNINKMVITRRQALIFK